MVPGLAQRAARRTQTYGWRCAAGQLLLRNRDLHVLGRRCACRPHFHARYSGQVASVALDGEIIAGSLPSRAAALVAEWATLHSVELEANWARARREESLEAIEPLP
jgi:Domain of unknown function (DUF4160)